MKFLEALKTVWTWLTNHKFISGIIVGIILESAFVLTILFAVIRIGR